MSRPALVALALVIGSAAAGALLLLDEGGEGAQPLLNRQGVAAEADLEPRQHLFGDVLTARAEVLLDRARVDPDAVTVQSRFRPYEPVAPQRVERKDVGDLTRLRFIFQLRCTEEACLLPTLRDSFTFEPGEVLVDGEPVADLEWPSFAVRSRVAEAAWRVNLSALPAPTYRVAPGVIAGVLAALAGVLVAAGAVFLVVALRRAPATAPRLPPLERALALLQAARRRAEPQEERKALDLLALELSRHGEGDLARTATELAWGRVRPASEATDELAERVEELVAARNGRRA